MHLVVLHTIDAFSDITGNDDYHQFAQRPLSDVSITIMCGICLPHIIVAYTANQNVLENSIV